MNAGEQLGAIARDLDRTGEAWEAAGYPSDGPEYEAREAVFARLREWNREQDERQRSGVRPVSLNAHAESKVL